MTNNSLDEMYKWLAVEPRTRGWNAILAYDRSKTNAVLLQEYINRFGTADYLEPISELLDDNQTATQRDYVNQYVVDAPRLSFINSSLKDSMAHVSQKIMGGSRLTYERPLGATEWKLIKVANWKPVNGPTLEYDIDLKVSPGSVDNLGTVSLNIAEGINYRMTYEETEHLAKFVGERFKARFARLPAPQKTFVLNEITIDKNSLIKPERFFIRTRNKKASGATLAKNEDDQEGAVLLFVTMEGQSDGLFPVGESDLRYLLPDGFSSTLLLGHEFFYEALVVQGLKKLANGNPALKYDLERESATPVIRAVHVREGVRQANKLYSVTIDGVVYESGSQRATMPGGGPTDIMRASKFESGSGDQSGWVMVFWDTGRQSLSLRFQGQTHPVPLTWMVGTYFSFSVDEITKEILLTPSGYPGGHISVDLSAIPMNPYHKERMTRECSSWIEDFLGEGLKEYANPVRDLNALMLHSLLFRGKNTIQARDTHFSHDLAIVGDVGPTLSAFTLNNLEPVIGSNDSFHFSTVPTVANVTWSVENISGDTSSAGTIDQQGKYSAPNAGQFPGDFTRVRVKATAGGNSSSALVSVLRHDLSINPLVMAVGAGDAGGREVSAGALGGAVLQWSMADPSKGGRVEPSVKEGGDHTYYPGPRLPNTMFVLDEIIVTHPHTKKTATSMAVVLHGQADLRVVIVPVVGGPANQVQLHATFGTGDPIVPPFVVTWSMFAGSGTVDADTGLFTVDPVGLHKFAFVTVVANMNVPGVPSFYGYILLPIPLFSVPEAIKMLDAVEVATSTEN